MHTHTHTHTHSGRILYYTHPPEQHTLPTHISADLVQEWGQAFDLVREKGRERVREGGREIVKLCVESPFFVM